MRNCFSKKKLYEYNLGLKKNHLLTLNDYLLSCDGGKRVIGGGGGGGGGGDGGGKKVVSGGGGGG